MIVCPSGRGMDATAPRHRKMASSIERAPWHCPMALPRRRENEAPDPQASHQAGRGLAASRTGLRTRTHCSMNRSDGAVRRTEPSVGRCPTRLLPS